MKVAVGSKNPIKVKAVEEAFKKVFGDCEIIEVSVSSGVSDMPMSFNESIKGAKTRAKKARKEIDADFGVGLEAGFMKTSVGIFLVGIVAIVDNNNQWGIGKGAGLLIPEKIVKEVKKGKELGDVMDEIRGLKNTKQKDGAVGYFTKNLIPRQQSFEIPVIYALSRFIRKEFFEK